MYRVKTPIPFPPPTLATAKPHPSQAEPFHISEAKVPVVSQVGAVSHCFPVFFHRIADVGDWEQITVRTVNGATTEWTATLIQRGSGYGYQLALLVWPY